MARTIQTARKSVPPPATLDVSPGLDFLRRYSNTVLMTEAKRRNAACVVADTNGDVDTLGLAAQLRALCEFSRPVLGVATVKNAPLPSIEMLEMLGKTRLAALVAIPHEGLSIWLNFSELRFSPKLSLLLRSKF